MKRMSCLLLCILIGGCSTGHTQTDTPLGNQPTIETLQVIDTQIAEPTVSPKNTTVPTSPPTSVSETPVEKEATQVLETQAEHTPPPLMHDVVPLEPAGGILAQLSKPAVLVRQGITLTVHQLYIYGDRVELLFTVENLPQSIKFDHSHDGENVWCGGPASYPKLELNDGKIIHPAPFLLDGRSFDLYDPYIRSFSAHIFYERIPDNTEYITFFLYCLELARTDKAPLGWRIPLEITW